MQIDPIDAPDVPKDHHLKLRNRFYEKFKSDLAGEAHFKNSACLFKGIEDLPKNYEDTNHIVEQESTFWYLFGVKETGCYAAILAESGKTVLFVPRMPEIYGMWMYVKPL